MKNNPQSQGFSSLLFHSVVHLPRVGKTIRNKKHFTTRMFVAVVVYESFAHARLRLSVSKLIFADFRKLLTVCFLTVLGTVAAWRPLNTNRYSNDTGALGICFCFNRISKMRVGDFSKFGEGESVIPSRASNRPHATASSDAKDFDLLPLAYFEFHGPFHSDIPIGFALRTRLSVCSRRVLPTHAQMITTRLQPRSYCCSW